MVSKFPELLEDAFLRHAYKPGFQYNTGLINWIPPTLYMSVGIVNYHISNIFLSEMLH